MPIIEIAVLIQVGSSIGLLSTLAIIIATAILGTFMLRQQGLATLAKAQNRMATGEMPAQQLMEGMILLVGGVLLLTPGFVTDAIGFICLIPMTRQWIAKRIARQSFISIMPGGGQRGAGFGPSGRADAGSANARSASAGPANAGPASSRPGHSGAAGNRRNGPGSREGDIIEGSFRNEDDANQ